MAQNNLNTDTNFQSKTIEELTPGYRINSSGDDPAGLAVANGYRDQEAQLTQGIANANDGISTLQIVDGGENNIGQILDRLQTLATQSASGTFTGDRNVLNSEFQGLVTEINRQAQSIGLDQGGEFAKSLSVYIGGGVAQGTKTAAQNSSVQLNLSGATVDAKSLGLTGMEAVGAANTDIGDSAATTSVADILAHNTTPVAGETDFYISGPGFSGANAVKVAVNTSSVSNTSTLVAAINDAIQNAGNEATPAAQALQAANITASINTDSSGKEQLAFSSSTTAFQVQAGDAVSNALLGNFAVAGQPQAANMTATVAGGENVTMANTVTNPGNITVQFTGAGLAAPVNITLSASDSTVASAVSDLQTQMATALAGTGISLATPAASGTKLTFSDSRGQTFNVAVTGDAGDALGFGSFQAGANSAFDYATLTAGATYDPNTANDAGQSVLQFSINGAASPTVTANLAAANAVAATATSAGAGNATDTITAANNMLSLAVNGTVVNTTLSNGVAATSGTAAAGTVNFGAAGVNTFNIAAATSGVETGSTVAGSLDTSTANQFTVSIDGGTAQTINLVAAAGQSQATIAGEITGQLGGKATASFVSNQLVITSASTGGNSSIQIGVGGSSGLGKGDATTLLGLDTTLHSGTAGNNQLNVTLDGGATTTVSLTTGAAVAGSQLITDINTQLGGVVATLNGANHLVLASTTNGLGSSIRITAPANSAATTLGLTGDLNTTYQGAAATDNISLSTIAGNIQTALNGAGVAATASVTSDNQIQIQTTALGQGASVQILNGTANTPLGFTTGTTYTGTNRTGADLVANLQQQFNSNAVLSAAGLTATWNTTGPSANTVTISSSNQTYFRLNAYAAGGGNGTTNASAIATNTVTATTGQYAMAGGKTLSIAIDGGNAITVSGLTGNQTASTIAGLINGTAGLNGVASVVTNGGQDTIKLVSNGTAGASDSLTLAGTARFWA